MNETMFLERAEPGPIPNGLGDFVKNFSKVAGWLVDLPSAEGITGSVVKSNRGSDARPFLADPGLRALNPECPSVDPTPQSPIAQGIEWSTRIMVVGLVAALPVLAGYGVDRWLGSQPVGVLVGVGLGLIAGLLQFVRLVQDLQRSARKGGPR